MTLTIVPVDSLLALRGGVPYYLRNYNLDDALYFRVDSYPHRGDFNYHTEVACFHDCYFAWKRTILKTRELAWPEARYEPHYLSDEDMDQVLYILVTELDQHRRSGLGLEDTRCVVFEEMGESPRDRLAWAVRHCSDMVWVEI
ncbi:hypothetical protein HDV62DRAFT_353117 [Trichoderma sp. SZMC 28011]